MNFKSLIVLSLPFFLLVSSCSQKKEIQRSTNNDRDITTSSKFSLLDSLQLHRFTYHTLAAKIKTAFINSDGSDINLTITLRSVSDSAIWMSASPALGIEAARILFTNDSIKIMDRINHEYAIVSYSFLKRFSQTEINFPMLQNILTGNAAFINNGLKTDSISSYYVAHCAQNELLQELKVSKLFRVFANVIYDMNTHDRINVSYGDFQFVETEYLPFDTKVEATSNGKSAKLVLNYNNVIVNAPVEIRFNIPNSYSKMKY